VGVIYLELKRSAPSGLRGLRGLIVLTVLDVGRPNRRRSGKSLARTFAVSAAARPSGRFGRHPLIQPPMSSRRAHSRRMTSDPEALTSLAAALLRATAR
jgi:hypothetical protein